MITQSDDTSSHEKAKVCLLVGELKEAPLMRMDARLYTIPSTLKEKQVPVIDLTIIIWILPRLQR